jgi:hypothetical protein
VIIAGGRQRQSHCALVSSPAFAILHSCSRHRE